MLQPLSTQNENLQKFCYGFASGALANTVAIPLSRISAELAADRKSLFSFSSYYGNMGRTLWIERNFSDVYKGGVARMMQKTITAVAYAFLPKGLVEEHPFSMTALTGFTCGLGANFFKLLQVQKVLCDAPYPKTASMLIKSAVGRRSYKENTLFFAGNEALRCVCCFGVSRFVRTSCEIDRVDSKMKKLWICLLASSIAAFVESTVSAPMEAVTIVHGSQITGSKQAKLMNVLQFLRENQMCNAKYCRRFYASVLIKNFFGNLLLTLGDQLRIECESRSV